ALATLTYSAIFGCLSLFIRRLLVVGVTYVIVFEGFFANLDIMVRKLTVMYYVRVLVERWLDLKLASWSIRLDEAPSSLRCHLTLLAVSLVTTIFAGMLMNLREFRVKTPEGS